MSHFTVLVIGENPEQQLAPYHEFECTGRDDQYIQEIDITDELRKDYETKITTRLINSKTGENLSSCDSRFYRSPTSEELEKDKSIMYWNKIKDVPDCWTEKKMPTKDVMSFLEYVKYWKGNTSFKEKDEEITENTKYGYIELDENREVSRVIDRTNPNAKWDWYKIGGRWTGFFPLKKGAEGVRGEPGLMTPHAKKGYVDQVRKSNVDFEKARKEKEEIAKENFDLWQFCFEKYDKPKSWKSFFDRTKESEDYTIEQARKDYNSQPTISKWKELKQDYFYCPVEEIGFDRNDYINKCINDTLVPFAVVKDGKWHERGEMGWWACVSNEMDEKKWCEEIQRLYDDLPDDTLLTLVDCHI